MELNCAGNETPVCKCRAVEQKLDKIITLLEELNRKTPEPSVVIYSSQEYEELPES